MMLIISYLGLIPCHLDKISSRYYYTGDITREQVELLGQSKIGVIGNSLLNTSENFTVHTGREEALEKILNVSVSSKKNDPLNDFLFN